jgi:hypothetical protein
MPDGSFSLIDPPGSISTFVSSLNNNGQVAGWYSDANGMYHGFIATPESATVPEPSTALLWLMNLAVAIVVLRFAPKSAIQSGV